MIRWIEEDEPRVDAWLVGVGQAGPVQEGTVKQGLSNVEKILLASVLISGTGLVVHLWELFGRKAQ